MTKLFRRILLTLGAILVFAASAAATSYNDAWNITFNTAYNVSSCNVGGWSCQSISIRVQPTYSSDTSRQWWGAWSVIRAGYGTRELCAGSVHIGIYGGLHDLTNYCNAGALQ